MPGLAIDVALAADSGSLPDLLAPWIDQFSTGAQNGATLLNNFAFAPFVAQQQWAVNLSGYLQQILDDPSNSTFANVTQQLQGNLAAVLTGYGLQGASPDTFSTVIEHTLEGVVGNTGHALLFGRLPSDLPASVDLATVIPILDFLASPLSGIIMGTLGPEISPWVALMNSITAGDDVNTTLANMVGAYFNGADLNLDSLIPAIEQSGYLPAGLNIANLDVAFGGLFTPGTVSAGPYEVGGNDIPAVGGSIFNSLGITLVNVPQQGTLEITSQPVGLLGALEGWAQTVASLLGWDGSGSPVDTVDTSGIGAAVADMSSWLQDLTSAL